MLLLANITSSDVIMPKSISLTLGKQMKTISKKMPKSDNISIRLLLIEDSENDALILIYHLKKEGINVEYERVYSEIAVREALKNKKWDIVISDYAMPGFDGGEALKIFKEMDIEIPFIMISGTIGEDVAVQTMRNGAHDYLMKDNLTRLVPAIKRELIDAKNRRDKKKNLAELIIAKERAEESDRLKSSFLATMSHELRTPLNSIIGFAELIANDIFSYEDVVENSKLIYQSGHHLLALINDMFDFSLIESGELKINKSVVSINKIFDRLEIDFGRDNKVRTGVIKLIFEKDFKYGKDKLYTDNIKFRQVLSNLIGNALKFTEKGLVKVGYKAIKDDAGNNFIEFFVKDSGIGIPENMHDIIFERFRQVEETHTRRFGGAGLGLSISKRIIKLLGGKNRVESQVGKGSTFYFTLPFDRKSIKEVPEIKFVADKKLYNWSEKKILVVEDVDSNYKLVEMMLRKTNAKVIRAVNGIEAIEKCKSDKKLDLVIMDIRLPDLSGYDATKIIKEMHPDLPVLAQTSYALSGDREISLQAGCDDYIPKPLDKSLFLSKINALLKRKKH